MSERKIRVGIDARLIHFPGIGRYIRCLIKGLSIYPQEVEPVIYLPPKLPIPEPGLEMRQIHIQPFSLIEQLLWPVFIKRDRLDIFHAPHYVFPIFAPCRLVVTVHDMVYFRYPPQGAKSRLLRAYYWFMHHVLAKRSNIIITVSEFSQYEILRYLRANIRKVFVIKDALDPVFQPSSDDYHRVVRKRYNLPDAFILYVGTNKPWKNLSTLLKSLAQVVQIEPCCKMVIAGKRGRREEEIEPLIRELKLDRHVMLIGEVPAEHLPTLYSMARIFVYPSLYEGFGLPPLEAMACGTPVICSNAASLPEVVGNAAILLDPLDQKAWRDSIIHLWHDAALRTTLRELGLARARQFSVEKMALETIAVYRKVLKL